MVGCVAVVETYSALARWLKQNDVKVPALAAACKVTRQAAYRYRLPLAHPDFRRPEPSVMIAIYVFTGGQITPNDFYDLPDIPLPALGRAGPPPGDEAPALRQAGG
jgi:hypothetical protein